jgi:hypothetical protein
MAELMTPGVAALLYGVIQGRSPASASDLLKDRLLLPSEICVIERWEDVGRLRGDLRSPSTTSSRSPPLRRPGAELRLARAAGEREGPEEDGTEGRAVHDPFTMPD